MGEICYIMRRVYRRSKNFDGSGLESLCCVDQRDVSKSLTWHLLDHAKFVADVNCRVWVCLNTKKDLGKNSFQQDPTPTCTVIRAVKLRACEGVIIILLRKEEYSRTSQPKKTKMKTETCRRQWGSVCRILLLAESPAYIRICVKFIRL